MRARHTSETRGTAARITRLCALAAIAVVVWACATEWGGIVHGHPAYAVVLGATTLLAIGALVSAGTRERGRGRWRTVGRVTTTLLAIAGIAIVGWLRPHTATDPSLTAMMSDTDVTVTETATSITFTPAVGDAGVGLFFQPGALVDARAYAAVLRPVAESGHTVVIAKQPLGIAFLSLTAFDASRSAHPDIAEWVIGGHSLGGTVAAQLAATESTASGLILFASYPASDISSADISAASISGTRDGLSTPEKIEASHQNLPADTVFVAIEGASHAQFGDYGTQSGDGTPTVSDDDARRQISRAAVDIVTEVALD